MRKVRQSAPDEIFKRLLQDADHRKELAEERKYNHEAKLKEKFESANQKYSENNQVFLCIRITKELKTTYEMDVRIDLGKKIAFPIFVRVLSLLGYLNSFRNDHGEMETKMTDSEEKLVQLAWQTVKTKFRETDKVDLDKKQIKGIPWSDLKHDAMTEDFDKTNQFAGYTQDEQQTVTRLIAAQRNQCDMEQLILPADYVVGLQDDGEVKLHSDDLPIQVRECVTFENFAMLLNLINNVYIKNTIQASSSSQIIDEEEEDSEANARPYGYVDSFNRFMVST